MKKTFLDFFENLKSCTAIHKAGFVTLISIFFSLLPLIIVFLCNIIRQKFYFSGITFALGMSFIYSLIIPGILGIIKESEYKMIHKGIHIIMSFIILVIYVIAIIFEKPLFENGVINYTFVKFIVSLFIIAAFLLFYCTYRDEKKGINMFNENDKANQDKIKKYSQNLNSKENNHEQI